MQYTKKTKIRRALNKDFPIIYQQNVYKTDHYIQSFDFACFSHIIIKNLRKLL